MATGINNVINIPKSDMQRPFSILVAANDSSAKGKSMADYVCDGTDDQVQINAAITSLTSGGEVHLLEGTYNIASTITMANNITLSGCGSGTILKIPDGNNSTMNVITIQGHNGTKIRSMQIDGNSGNNSTGTQHGIYVRDATNTTYTTTTDIEISNCYIHHFLNNGISSYLGGNQDRIKSLKIHDNTISNCVYGIYVYPSIYAEISGNYVSTCSNTGIAADVYGEVSGNSVISCLVGISAGKVTSNTVIGTGINVANSIGIGGNYAVSGNLVSDVNIGIQNGGAVSGNYIFAGSYGIKLTGMSGNITGNSINASGSGNNIGIDGYNSPYIVVAGNYIRTTMGTGTTSIGIRLTNLGASAYSNTLLLEGVNGTAYGIVFDGSFCYCGDAQCNHFYGGTVGLVHAGGLTNIRALNNTGYNTTAMTSGTFQTTAGNTSFSV